MKKGCRVIFGYSLLLILLVVPLVSAGFFDFFLEIRDSITGRDTSDTVSVNITIGNNAPEIVGVQIIDNQSITEEGSTNVEFTFLVNDTDGNANLNHSSAMLFINKSGGEEIRSNTSCGNASVSDTQVNYTCAIDIWYFDGNGAWSINFSVRDNSNSYTENSSEVFYIELTTAMKMDLTNLTWNSLSLTSTDELATNNPLTLNNTGNKNITDGNLKVTAQDLQGETTDTDYLLASNFSVNPSNACGGTALEDNVATGISGAILNKGNNSNGDGQEEIYFCLEEITSGIEQQSYSTAGAGSSAWSVEVF